LVESLSGPLAPTALNGFLDTIQPILAPELMADPDNNMPGGVTGYFDSLRQWTIDRAANVCAQVVAEYPDLIYTTTESPLVGDMNGDAAVDASDASLLVLSLVNRAAFDAAHSSADVDTIGDVNYDGRLDTGDLSGLGVLYSGSAAA